MLGKGLALKDPPAQKAGMEPPALPAEPAPTQDEKNLALIMHVLSLVGFSLIGPLIVWLVKKDESAFINAQGRENVNPREAPQRGTPVPPDCLRFCVKSLQMNSLLLMMSGLT